MGRVLLLCLVGLAAAVAGLTVEEKLKEDSDLSQVNVRVRPHSARAKTYENVAFLALLERNVVADANLKNRQLTLFAPTNEAFQRFSGELDESLVLYHMSNLATTLPNLGYSVTSELDGSPPLWITRRRDTMHDDIYVNNARVIASRTFQSTIKGHIKQVLHVIDEVLQPVQQLSPSSSPVYNPNAYQFLERSEELNIGTHRLRTFRQKVNKLGKKSIFQQDGRFTFFIPVEEGFKPTLRTEHIDAKVIDGHVIPDHVLFTHATPDEKPYETMAFGDNIKVTVSFTTTKQGKDTLTYVKSNTALGDNKHSGGVVMADIVKGNIPVKNGVVHLIQRPLMIVDTSVSQFLEGIDKPDGPLFKFYEVMMDLGGKFFEDLKQMKDLTLFAPSNDAWKDSNLNNVIRNKQKLNEILSLHLVRERLSLEQIMHNNMHQIYQVPTAASRKYLYFNIIQHRNNQTLTVEGGGVNATVVQPNIAATNGFVHIINRVLGVPYTTVLEKLKTDPMLNASYHLGRRRSFNNQLEEKTHRYTYFAPRDLAWQAFQTKHPSTYRKLYLDEFSYYTKQIMERHLIRADRAYTMADMKLLANESHPIVLPTLRDSLRLRIKETDKNYYVEWNNRWVHVFRPDVECTNGIIHVIDEPFILESDIIATGAAPTVTHLGSALVLVLSFAVARMLE